MKVSIGQDSHAFDFDNNDKALVLGGIEIPDAPPLRGNSDADVVLHAITNAISGITTVNILGKIADDMCENGITDSAQYLAKALEYLDNEIVHLSISIEALKPKLSPHIESMRKNIANLLSITPSQVGITATTGEGLTAFGRGEGIQVFCILTVE